MGHIMTLQRLQNTETSSAVLTDEQRRRVADALEDAQSENTRKNYASQFRAGCEQEDQSPLSALPEVVAAYAAEVADDGKNMSTVRLAVSAIVDAHRRVGLDSPVVTRQSFLPACCLIGKCYREFSAFNCRSQV